MNAEEQSENERSVVNTRDALREVSITQTVKGDKQVDRTYNFDQVFGAHATQEDIYDDAVRPIVEEVLEGFNCTIFAYGQTGTGKTHTMEGYHDWDDASSDSFADSMPSDAGVIPRAMSHIFAHLRAKGVEHSVKCTFLELYNEEITDLLAVSDLVEGTVEAANAKAPKHPLMEDGKGGVAVKGLEEVAVANPEEIFDHIRRGSAKRRTAETLMNKQSSRSHSVFSVTVHTKESTPDGEDVIRCGKLNLVDLAGSENISRSGAVDKRAREAGEINKSLLTLGRVISALVAGGGGHVPYRDSKLTRLLRDALGGKSKTCIIATVSPASHSAEETLQTLEYAHRAKSIKNKPEINQRVTKNALLKDLQKEIERLTADLTATREKNGVYLSQQSYEEQEKERVDLRARADELRSALDLAKSELASLVALFEDQKKAHKALQREHATHAEKVCIAERTARVAHAELSKAQRARLEQAHLADEFEAAQERLRVKTDSLGDALASAKDEMRSLFGKIERYSDVDAANASVIESVRLDVTAHLERLEASLAEVKTAEESARTATRYAVEDAKKARSAEADELRDQLRRTRADAEAAWLRLHRDSGVPVHIFRLAGIYGPGRSALDQARNGSARRIDKPGHLFSRIHVDDIANVLWASIARPDPGAVYNVCDDEPAAPADVTAEACRLLGIAPPPLVPFDEAAKDMSEMAKSFWRDNRRVANGRIKRDLDVRLRYPDYRAGLKAVLDAGG